MVVIGPAAIEGVVQAEGDLAIWSGILPGGIAACWLQSLMVCMPAWMCQFAIF